MSWDISRIQQLAGVPLNESMEATHKHLAANEYARKQATVSQLKAAIKFFGSGPSAAKCQAELDSRKNSVKESYDADDGDDGMSASERAIIKKAEDDLKKKGIKVKDADPDKDLHDLAQRRKAKEKAKEEAEDKEEAESKAAAAAEKKAEDDKEAAPKKEPEAKKEEPKKEAPKAEDKKEDPTAAEAKRRGKAPNPDSMAQKALAWIKANPDATGGQFKKWAAGAGFEMGANYANTFFHGLKAKARAALKQSTNECYMLGHTSIPSFLLSENKMMNQYQWIDPSSPMDPLVFETEAEAKKVAQYIYEWKNQTADIVKIDFSDE